jgi:hypothetical protein
MLVSFFCRIERFWRDVFYGCLSYYKLLFIRLEAEGLLNIDDPRHLYLLHWVFLPRLQNHLQIFKDGWNSHPISSERNMTPDQMMVLHRLPEMQELSPFQVFAFLMMVIRLLHKNLILLKLCLVRTISGYTDSRDRGFGTFRRT